METVGAWLYDGETAMRHDVEVGRAGDVLVIRYADGDVSQVPRASLFHSQSRAEWEVYGHEDLRGWRLGLPAPLPRELEPALPRRKRYGAWIDRIGLIPSLLILALVSGLVVGAANRFPAVAAPYLPRSVEERFGGSMVNQFAGYFCRGPGGEEALAKLARQLAPEAGPLDIRVVNYPLVNAAALPGGRILIFNGLLTAAEGPEEVAGVLAHEIAHIENLDVSEALIRHFTVGLFLTMIGGNIGAGADTLLTAGYSRGVEEEADETAIAMLRRANVSPLGAAAFFEKVAAEEREMDALTRSYSYLSTHPNPESRQLMFRRSAQPGRFYDSTLSEEEWLALQEICLNDPDQRDEE